MRIARRVANDRMISTADTEARHGHKSRARTFDGYKSHLGIDPDDELITGVAITPANAADREVIDQLLGNPATDTTASAAPDTATDTTTTTTDTDTDADADADDADADADETITGQPRQVNEELASKTYEVYGDSAYAGGATLVEQTGRGHDMRAKVPPVRNAGGYSKDRFGIDGRRHCHLSSRAHRAYQHRPVPMPTGGLLRCVVPVVPTAG